MPLFPVDDFIFVGVSMEDTIVPLVLTLYGGPGRYFQIFNFEF